MEPYPSAIDGARLRSRIHDLLEAFGATAAREAPGDRALLRFQELAEIGRNLFDAIIAPEFQSRFLAQLPLAAADLQRPIIIAHAEGIRVPWSLLFTADPPQDLSETDGFLGARYLFLNEPLLTIQPPAAPGDRLAAADAAAGGGDIGHIWDESFLAPSGQTEDGRWYRQLSTLSRAPMPPLVVDAASPRPRALAALSEFVSLSRDALQLDCHGKPTPGSLARPDVTIRDNYTAANDEVVQWSFARNQTILIGLNVCRAARSEFSDEADGSLAEGFLSRGAGAAIGPLTTVGYELAMDFSSVLYAQLEGGASYLDAFDAAQTEAAARDPAALTYCLFGSLQFLRGSLQDAGLYRKLNRI